MFAIERLRRDRHDVAAGLAPLRKQGHQHFGDGQCTNARR